MTQRKRIGDRLLDAGLITQEHLDIAVQEQKKTGELLGAILFSHGFISQNDLLQVLSCSHDGSAEALPKEESVDIPEELAYLVKQSSSAFQGEGAG